MKVGITGLVIPGEWSFDEILSNITADGYSAFELAQRDKGYLTFDSAEAELRDLAAKAADAGVELVSMCPGFRGRPKALRVYARAGCEGKAETATAYVMLSPASPGRRRTGSAVAGRASGQCNMT